MISFLTPKKTPYLVDGLMISHKVKKKTTIVANPILLVGLIQAGPLRVTDAFIAGREATNARNAPG